MTKLQIAAVALLCGTLVSWHAPVRSADDTDVDRKDCPGPSWKKATPVKFAPITADIPEFHDCQRFIDKTNRYGALYAVILADTSQAGQQLLNDKRKAEGMTAAHTVAVAVAEVITPKGDYPSLGVHPGRNCLYLSSANGWARAYMFSSGETDETCPWVISTAEATVTPLNVRRTMYPNYKPADFPTAARWQIDARSGRYIIGVSCDAGWCEIGVDKSEKVLAAADVGGIAPAKAHVYRVQGWFDEQRLAIHSSTTTAEGVTVEPSSVIGKATPDWQLKSRSFADFNAGWVYVGSLHLPTVPTGYTSKLGVSAGDNKLYFRRFPGDVWKARIIPANGPPVTRDVIRTDHKGVNVPATMRWRWLGNDETVWARCVEGCCQVQQSDQ